MADSETHSIDSPLLDSPEANPVEAETAVLKSGTSGDITHRESHTGEDTDSLVENRTTEDTVYSPDPDTSEADVTVGETDPPAATVVRSSESSEDAGEGMVTGRLKVNEEDGMGETNDSVESKIVEGDGTGEAADAKDSDVEGNTDSEKSRLEEKCTTRGTAESENLEHKVAMDAGGVSCTGGTDKMSSQPLQCKWKDITEDFMSASGKLGLGELMHDTVFGLFEAMSAIEMMDPKMDAGMMCNQAKHPVLNLEQSIEVQAIKVDDIKMEELIGIIDDTLACLVTWLEGHSLAQTVFTNLYLHDPQRVEDRPLKAFCICTLKIVDLARDRISRAAVFEEEDFQPMAYGFKMAADVTDVRVTGMMKEVEEELNRVVKNTRSRAGEDRDPATERDHELATGVHARLKFCRLFFTTLLAFQKDKCAGISDAQKFLGQLSELLPVISRTVDLGVKAEETSDDTADYETISGFEPLVNQRLLPPTFPRYTKIKKRDETMTYLGELIERLKSVCSVTQITGLHTLLEFFQEFSKTSPCVLSRSLLQLVVLAPSRRLFGTQNIVDVLRDTIRNFIAPPALMPKSVLANSPQVKECVDACLTHAVRPICSIFQITGHNRARQRDKWGHLLEDLANLQDEADKVDAYLHQLLTKVEPSRQHLACFGNWVLYHTLHVMINYTLAGFELELYAIHEYHYVFWYLYECLYNWLISTLSRADTFLLEQETIAEQQQKGRGSKKNKKRKKARPHTREIVLAQAAQNLCGGYFKAIEGLLMDKKLKPPKFDFDREEVRYNHRFAPFGNVGTPPPVPYSQFQEMTNINKYDPPPNAASFYSWSCKCFSQARNLYESILSPNSEVQVMIKIAKTNFVVMKLLLGGHKKDSTDSPEFDFSLHPIFPVIKL